MISSSLIVTSTLPKPLTNPFSHTLPVVVLDVHLRDTPLRVHILEPDPVSSVRCSARNRRHPEVDRSRRAHISLCRQRPYAATPGAVLRAPWSRIPKRLTVSRQPRTSCGSLGGDIMRVTRQILKFTLPPGESSCKLGEGRLGFPSPGLRARLSRRESEGSRRGL